MMGLHGELLTELQILCEKLSQLVPRNQVLWLTLTYQFRISAIIEVAMRGIGDDEQLLILWIGIWLTDHVISFSLSIYHIVIGSFTKVARVCLLTMHHEYGGTNLVDVIEETTIRECLRADDTPTIGGVTAALVIATLGFIVVKVIFDELWCIVG